MHYFAIYTRENDVQAWKFSRVAERTNAEHEAEVNKNFGLQTLIMDVRILLPKYLDSDQTIITGMKVVA